MSSANISDALLGTVLSNTQYLDTFGAYSVNGIWTDVANFDWLLFTASTTGLVTAGFGMKLQYAQTFNGPTMPSSPSSVGEVAGFEWVQGAVGGTFYRSAWAIVDTQALPSRLIRPIFQIMGTAIVMAVTVLKFRSDRHSAVHAASDGRQQPHYRFPNN